MLRRLASLNWLYYAASTVHPSLRIVPLVVLAATAAVVAFIAIRTRTYEGPRAKTTKEQAAEAERRRHQVSRERLASVVADGMLSRPLSEFVEAALLHRDRWHAVIETLRAVRVHRPANALSPELRDKVWKFLNANLEDFNARRLALAIFRVGGPPPRIFELAERFTAPEEANWFFDSVETMQLLDDRSAWPHHNWKRIRPWTEALYPLRRVFVGRDAAFGIFDGGDRGWVLRAGGPGMLPEECKVEWSAVAKGYLEKWEKAYDRPLGPKYFRQNDIRDGWREPGRHVPWSMGKQPGDIFMVIECGPGFRYPATGVYRFTPR